MSTPLEKAAYRPVEILIGELGYLEKASNANLDSKTANAGHKNYTKFAQYFDDLRKQGINFYNGRKQGAEWCDITVDWAQCQAWGPKMAMKVLYQPSDSCGAGCCWSARYFKDNKAWIARTGIPKTGDQIFFGPIGDESHTGIVEKVDSSYVYTIEGNSNDALMRRKYARGASNIAGYGRPNYALVADQFKEVPPAKEPEKPKIKEDEIDMTKDEVQKMINDSIEKIMGPMVNELKDIPWKSVQKEFREILDSEAIDGGTPSSQNPNDIKLPLNTVRALVGAKRYIDKKNQQ